MACGVLPVEKQEVDVESRYRPSAGRRALNAKDFFQLTSSIILATAIGASPRAASVVPRINEGNTVGRSS